MLSMSYICKPDLRLVTPVTPWPEVAPVVGTNGDPRRRTRRGCPSEPAWMLVGGPQRFWRPFHVEY